MSYLVAGLVVAGSSYWWRTRDAEPSVDDLLPGFSAADARQMAILYGKTGARAMGWMEDLERPDVDAALIGLAGVIAGGLCFRVARLSAEDHGSGA